MVEASTLRAVLLDLDDTLVPWETVRHWQWAWRPRGPVLGERHTIAAIRRTRHAWDRRRWEGLVGSRPAADATAYREHLGAALEAVAGHPLPPETAGPVVERFLHPAHEFERFPDVTAALRGFEAAGVRVGVVTALPEDTARTMLERAGLARDLLVLWGEVPNEPTLPASAAFRTAAQRLEVRPSQAMFVGDLYWSDVRAAARVGMTAVLVDRDEDRSRGSGVSVRSLSDAPALLRSPPSPPVAETPSSPPEPPAS